MVAEFRGSLYVFVDGADDEPSPASGTVFDSHEPGTLGWYLSGQALGKNARGSYCARTSATKRRRFATFAEAMDTIRAKRKARPQERFYLVYELEGKKAIVSSLEQILRLDGRLPSADKAQAPTEKHPALDMMSAKVGQIVAANALDLHRILQHEGESVARSRFSPATYDRLWRVLLEAGVVTNEAPPA